MSYLDEENIEFLDFNFFIILYYLNAITWNLLVVMQII